MGEATRGPKPRQANKIPTVTVKISTTPAVVEYLKRLANTQMFGKTYTETAEQLVRERLREIYGAEILKGPPAE